MVSNCINCAAWTVSVSPAHRRKGDRWWCRNMGESRCPILRRNVDRSWLLSLSWVSWSLYRLFVFAPSIASSLKPSSIAWPMNLIDRRDLQHLVAVKYLSPQNAILLFFSFKRLDPFNPFPDNHTCSSHANPSEVISPCSHIRIRNVSDKEHNRSKNSDKREECHKRDIPH